MNKSWKPEALLTQIKNKITPDNHPHLYVLLEQETVQINLIYLFKQASLQPQTQALKTIHDWITEHRYDGLWDIVEEAMLQQQVRQPKKPKMPHKQAKSASKQHPTPETSTPLPNVKAEFIPNPYPRQKQTSHSQKTRRKRGRNSTGNFDTIKSTGNHETISKLKARRASSSTPTQNATRTGNHETIAKLKARQKPTFNASQTGNHETLSHLKKRSKPPASVTQTGSHNTTKSPKRKKSSSTPSEDLQALFQKGFSKSATPSSGSQKEVSASKTTSQSPHNASSSKSSKKSTRNSGEHKVKTDPMLSQMVKDAILTNEKKMRTEQVARIVAGFVLLLLVVAGLFWALD